MSAFAYRAYDAQGIVREGEVTADSEQAALQAVKAQGLLPFVIITAGHRSTFNSLLPKFETSKTLSHNNRERYLSSLATLLEAGFLLPECHRFLANDISEKALSSFASGVLEKLQSGQTLSASLRGSDGGFDMAELAAIAAGEKSGDFAGPLRHVSLAMKASNANRDKLVSALIYPIVLVLTSLASIVVVATVLVPNLLPIFEGREQDMPVAMRLLIALKAIIADNMPIIAIAVLGFVILVRQLIKNRTFQSTWQNMKRKIAFARKLEAARIAGSIALMLRGGTTVLGATKICSENAGNATLAGELKAATERLSEGKAFREAINHIATFGPIERQMLSIAEQANKLETVLDHIAKTNEADATRQLERLMGLLTPVMTLLMGLLIGGLIYSVMRSILSINQLVQ